MVETKNRYLLDDASISSPPLVPAHIVPDLRTLTPISVSAVSIDDATIDEISCHADLATLQPITVPISVNAISIEEVTFDETPCEASYISIDSIVEKPVSAEDMDEATRTWSAAVAGGVIGSLLGGPVLGIVTGSTAAYFSGQDGVGGDTARALGEVALTTEQKAKELNRKHHLVERSKGAAESAWRKMKELDKEHDLAKKGQAAASSAWKGAKDFNRKHGVAEKMGDFAALCFKRIAKFVAEVSGRLIENGPAAVRDSSCPADDVSPGTEDVVNSTTVDKSAPDTDFSIAATSYCQPMSNVLHERTMTIPDAQAQLYWEQAQCY